MLIRKSWFRVTVVVLTIVVCNSVVMVTGTENLRDSSLQALRSVILILSICTVVCIALMNNYVKGKREEFQQHVEHIKDLLEKLDDKLSGHRKQIFIDLRLKWIYPFLSLKDNEWTDRDKTDEIYNKIDNLLSSVSNEDSNIGPRFLMRIENAYNELFILILKRMVTELHLDTIRGTFALIIVAGIVTGLSFLIPSTPNGDFLAMNLSIATILFSLLELALIFSWLYQEGKEEAIEGDE